MFKDALEVEAKLMASGKMKQRVEVYMRKIRDLNFKIHVPPPQIRQRDPINPRNPKDRLIRPPFPENYVDEEEENDPMDNQIHHFHDLDSDIYLSEEENNFFPQEDDCNTFEVESEQY